MSQLKVISISFFVVFMLFALLAFFTGSSLFWSFFKAFVSACLVTVFLLGANFFLVRYIPDFFEDKQKEEVIDSNAMGSNLDIRIADDSASSFENVMGNSVPSNEANFESIASGDLETAIHSDDSAGGGKLQEGVSLSLEGQLSDLSDEKKDGDVTSDMKESVLEVHEGTQVGGEASEAELSGIIEKDEDMLDELPDLHEFVDSSNLQGEQTKGEELMNTGTQSFFATDLSDDVSDTNLMAKAVRTVLKREV